MASEPPKTRKTMSRAAAARAELLTLSLMLKAEVDALLQRTPKAFVAVVEGSVSPLGISITCSAGLEIKGSASRLPTRKHDPRLAGLEYLPHLGSLIKDCGCEIDQDDLTALTQPKLVQSSQAPGVQCQLRLFEINAQRLQNLLRRIIVGSADGTGSSSAAAAQEYSRIVTELLVQMRRVVVQGKPGFKPLKKWEITHPNRNNRSTFQIGTGGSRYSSEKVRKALRKARVDGLISIQGPQRSQKYRPTDLGLAVAAQASFLLALRKKTEQFALVIRFIGGNRVESLAPATRGRRRRVWLDHLVDTPRVR